MKIPVSKKEKIPERTANLEVVLSGDQPPNGSGSRRETCAHALDATIQVIQQVIDLVPIDIAKNALIGITSILLLLQKNVKNKDDLKGLARRCDIICSTLAQATKDVSTDDMSDTLSGALQGLGSSIDELYSNITKALQRSRFRMFAGAGLHEKEITGWTGELDSVLMLFSAQVNIVSGIYSEQTYRLLKHSRLRSSRPELPPPSPAFFFGREQLFAQVKDAVFRDEDVALIGPGGIGKSTIAKALLNDDTIRKRYMRRFFVTYDGVDPATITLDSFVDRIANVLGLPTLGAESKNQVIANLASSPTLIVLDNAESFEDAGDPEAADQIEAVVADIANTRRVTVILTSRTSCNARKADWTQVRVPPLSEVPAREYFRKIYRGEIRDDDVEKVLAALDFHPLSIHILAHTARESQWTGEELLDEWDSQQSRLLQTGRRKEDLGFTIRLSLSSPSVKVLGDNALGVLHTIAFFPQGINRKHITSLFPSIVRISSLVDTLCKVSLVYRSGTFLTTLAPIRLFLLDAFPVAGLDLLGDIRRMYYGSLERISRTKDLHANLLITDHLNVEHLIAFDMAHTPDSILDATDACRQFLFGLEHHKLRPTSLTPVIFSLPEGSQCEKDSKAKCLNALGSLYFELSNFAVSGTARVAASTLFVAIGNYDMASSCIEITATSHLNQGYYSLAQQLLEDFIRSPPWQRLDERCRARVYYLLDWHTMLTSREGADKLFLRSVDHELRGRTSRVLHWAARMYHGYSTLDDVDRNLEPIRSLYTSSCDARDRWRFLEVAANAVFLQGRFEVAMELLNEARDAADGDFLLTLIVLKHKAAVGSVQGKYDLARSLLQHTLDTLSMVATPSSVEFLEMRYVHGRNEMYAKNYPEARRLLADVIVDCDTHDNIRTKMMCTRALGEVELLLGCKSKSDHYFAQTVALCGEAGVPPELLRICEPMMKLEDAKFPGWLTFLRAQTG